MPTPPGQPYTGPIKFDLSDVQPDLVDLVPGAMSRLRQEQDGFDGVVKELKDAEPLHDEAGISPVVYKHFLASNDSIDKLEVHVDELAKAYEVAKESLAKKVHERENDCSQMAESVKRTAKNASRPEMTAPYEKLLSYVSQAADKAASTRKKNEEAKAAAAHAAPSGEKAPAAGGGQTPAGGGP